jgi:hypothetical protein
MTKSSKALVTILMLSSSVAFADTITQTDGAVSPALPSAAIDIELTGVLESSVTLVVDAARMVQTAADAGQVDFGSFSTNSFGTVNADRPARDADDDGLWLAVDVNATITYSGVNGANVALDRVADPAGLEIPAGNLFAAANQAQIDDQGDAGLAVIDGPCTSGQSIDHQLALYIPDTQAAGTFTTVVSYSATTN